MAPGFRNCLTSTAAYGRHRFVKHVSYRNRVLYHSHQHPPSLPPFSPIASSILSAGLNHVPEQGFTDMALTVGARDVGYLDITTNLFPRGAFELVYYHLVQERLNLHQRVQLGKELAVEQKVRMLVLERLRANERIHERLQEVSELEIWNPCAHIQGEEDCIV